MLEPRLPDQKPVLDTKEVSPSKIRGMLVGIYQNNVSLWQKSGGWLQQNHFLKFYRQRRDENRGVWPSFLLPSWTISCTTSRSDGAFPWAPRQRPRPWRKSAVVPFTTLFGSKLRCLMRKRWRNKVYKHFVFHMTESFWLPSMDFHPEDMHIGTAPWQTFRWTLSSNCCRKLVFGS